MGLATGLAANGELIASTGSVDRVALPIVSVSIYNADPTGATDSAAAITSAIAALPTTGGIVYFPAGTYLIKSTIAVGNGTTAAISTRNGITLRGAAQQGTDLFGPGTPPAPAVTIKWDSGTAGDVMVSANLVYGWGIENITLDGANTATVGLQEISSWFGRVDRLTIKGCLTGHYRTTNNWVGSPSNANLDGQFNRYIEEVISIPNATAVQTVGLKDDNFSGPASDPCFSVWDGLTILFTSGSHGEVGIWLKDCDSEDFRKVHFVNFGNANAGAVGSSGSACIYFDYTGNSLWPTNCDFDLVDFASSSANAIQNNGTPNTATAINRIRGVVSANGAPVDPALPNLLYDDSAVRRTLLPPDPFLAAGVIAETVPRRSSSLTSIAVLTSGEIVAVPVYLPEGKTITSITFSSGNTAAVAPTHWWFELRDKSFAILRQTADQTSTAWATNTSQTVNLATTYATTYTGLYWLTIMVTAGTVPTLIGVSQSAAGAANIQALAPYVTFIDTAHTGLTTPATAPATATQSVATSPPFAYVS